MAASAILVAAGSSRRMGFDKLGVELAGKPVLAWSIEAFESCPDISEIVVVASDERFGDLEKWQSSFGWKKVSRIVSGGAERHLSVWNGLEAIDAGSEFAAVHDGARPLIQPKAISLCLESAGQFGAAVLGHPVTDTLKRADSKGEKVESSVSRENLWAMETPQCFSVELLKEAYGKILSTGEIVTDEVSALQKLGREIRLIENPDPNPKITFRGDLIVAGAILENRDY
ncbi:MAG: 2-C-methyl-D-erythritol 4-phosphate cytidylyltransferase [Verrucomicrobiales bacterium]|nr:2-C-methyl-D-erythritol 4-phosphate cytidylyltransferase [Verrucomicrobiales bacterium]